MRFTRHAWLLAVTAVLAACVVTAVLAACVVTAVPPSPSPSPTPSANPTPSPAWIGFTSERYGYALEHPGDWMTRQVPGAVLEAGMRLGSPGSDLIGPRDAFRYGMDDGLLAIHAHELLPGESLEAFTDRFSRSAACGSPGKTYETLELSGEPAESRRFDCGGHDWLQVTALHGEMGYVVWMVATQHPLPHERPINDAILATFRFTD